MPRSNLAVTGLYFFDSIAPKLASQLKPSPRGELEITDLNLLYLESDNLLFHELGRGIVWFDAGTPASLLDAPMYVSAIETRQHTKIAAPEEIALQISGLLQTNFYVCQIWLGTMNTQNIYKIWLSLEHEY